MKWDLTRIYKSKEDWELDVKSLKEDALKITEFKGKLNNKDDFKKFLVLDNALDMKLSKCYVYASMSYDLNQKDTKNQEMYATIYSAYNEVIGLLSFVTPEILANGKDTVEGWLDDSLSMYKYYVERLFRNEAHVLDAKVESVLANYNQALGSFNLLYDQLAVADNKGVDVTLHNGEVINVTDSNYRLYLEKLPEQEDRRKVFEAVFKFYANHKSTFAGIYNGIMQSEMAEVKTRGYSSILESHLYGNKIDTNVFLSLIKTTRENTEPIKKYYELRRKFFNLKKIHTYDRFLQLAESDLKFDYDSAKELFFKSTKMIGGDFEKMSHLVLEDGRVDVMPGDGKRTGAYSTGLYDEGPFILLNHTGSLDSAFTLAHEAGHSMHTMFANEAQPYVTSNYVIFVAEIASTFNESLLLDYLMTQDLDKNTKIVLLQKAIDNILGTFYRQSLFANYEYEAHKLVEDGKPVTEQALSDIMKSLYKDYYDINLDEEEFKEYVWAYIPHFFHTPFYVYQYATSFAASSLIYDAVKNKKPGAFESYLNLLKAGGSDYPVELVKRAGVDLTSKEPFMAVVNRLKELVLELEKLLDL